MNLISASLTLQLSRDLCVQRQICSVEYGVTAEGIPVVDLLKFYDCFQGHFSQ